MVQKITIFEPHIDGAQFGPSTLGTDAETFDEESEMSDESGSSMVPKLAFLGFLTAVAAAGVLFYRRRNGHRIEIEEVSSETVEAEQ